VGRQLAPRPPWATPSRGLGPAPVQGGSAFPVGRERLPEGCDALAWVADWVLAGVLQQSQSPFGVAIVSLLQGRARPTAGQLRPGVGQGLRRCAVPLAAARDGTKPQSAGLAGAKTPAPCAEAILESFGARCPTAFYSVNNATWFCPHKSSSRPKFISDQGKYGA
jgi:hypothetical protein